MWHLLTLGAMATCLWLSAWQWQRAGSAYGSALNVGYGLQWPLFAIFFGVMWWRMLRMEAAKLDQPDPAAEQAEPTPVDSPVLQVPPPVAPGPSPFGPRPRTFVAPAAADPADDADDRALAAYNRMLAQLAARTPDDRP
jgi:hypothetical protein